MENTTRFLLNETDLTAAARKLAAQPARARL